MQPLHLMGAGVILSILALFFVLFSELEVDDISEKDLANVQGSLQKKAPQDTSIKYSSTESSSPVESKSLQKKAIQREPKKIDNSIKFIAHDQKRHYTLYLIDENETPLKNPKKKTTFSGKIDGSSFAMRVPQELLHENLSIKVKNNKTGEVKTVPIPFLADIQPGRFLPKVEIDFANIDNYNVVFPTAETMDFPGQSIYD